MARHCSPLRLIKDAGSGNRFTAYWGPLSPVFVYHWVSDHQGARALLQHQPRGLSSLSPRAQQVFRDPSVQLRPRGAGRLLFFCAPRHRDRIIQRAKEFATRSERKYFGARCLLARSYTVTLGRLSAVALSYLLAAAAVPTFRGLYRYD